MIEAVIVIGLLAAAWGSISPDRLAKPTRSAVRSGAAAGARSAWKSTRSAWTTGQPIHQARHERVRAWIDDTFGRFGRGANWFTDRVQSAVGGIGSVAWSAAGIGWQASRDGAIGCRDGWRQGRHDHRQRRENGERGRVARWLAPDRSAPDVSDPCPTCGEQRGSQSDVCEDCEAVTSDRDPAASDDPELTDPPSPGGTSNTPLTPKENAVPQPAAQLDIPDINALQALATQLAAASEIATQMAGHSATTTGLPDALAFDAGVGVNEAIHALAEASPDPKALGSWAELVHGLKRVVDKRVAELEILSTAQVKGHTDQLTPA